MITKITLACFVLFPLTLTAQNVDPFETATFKELMSDRNAINKDDFKKFLSAKVPEFLKFFSETAHQDHDLYEMAAFESIDLYEDYTEMKMEGRQEEAENLLQYKYNEFRSWQLGKEIQNIRAQDNPNMDALKRKEKELYSVLEAQYQIKLQYQQKEFDEMKRELDELGRALKKRAQLKEQIIRRRILELSGDDDVMDWD